MKGSWNNDQNKTLDLTRLVAFEKEKQFKLPNNYRSWLISTNGGVPEANWLKISDAYGYCKITYFLALNNEAIVDQLDYTNETLRENIAENLIAIARDEGGNYLCIASKGDNMGGILFWDHETSDTTFISSDFEEISSLFLNEEDVIAPSPFEDLEKIIEKDSVESLAKWLESDGCVEFRGEYERTPIELAAISNSPNCISYLHEQGSKKGNALELAKNNLKYFPEYADTVQLLNRLYGD